MAYVPLAVQADLTATPLGELVRQFASGDIDKHMARASRALESDCNRRLAQFTGLTETHRADFLNDYTDGSFPYGQDVAGAQQEWSARAFGNTGDMVRHMWLNQYPPMYPELWMAGGTSLITAMSVSRDYSGTMNLNPVVQQYEVDTGHVRFQLGSFIPVGSTLSVTYSGGYTTVPEDLVIACIYKAGVLAYLEIDPEDPKMGALNEGYSDLVAPWVRRD